MTNETMTFWEERRQQAEHFVAALGQLDAAGRARLKRNAGRALAEARDVHAVFFQALPYGVARRYEEDYFLLATLFPLLPHSPQAGNLGDSLHQVRQQRGGGDSPASFDRRVQALLDSDREQVWFRLRQMIRLVATQKGMVGVNWEQLLLDILDWERDDRRVQLDWARAYFVGSKALSTQVEDTQEGE